MGIARLAGRDVVRLLTDACEREGRLAWSEARVVGEEAVVGPAPCVDTGVKAATRHSAADRTRVRRVPPSGGEDRQAS